MRLHPPKLRRIESHRLPVIEYDLVCSPCCALQNQTIHNECLRIIHPLHIHAQIECFQAPALAMCDCLACRSNICLREEEPAEPDFKVSKRCSALCCDASELSQAACEVGNPFGDGSRARNLVLAPVGGDGACVSAVSMISIETLEDGPYPWLARR